MMKKGFRMTGTLGLILGVGAAIYGGGAIGNLLISSRDCNVSRYQSENPNNDADLRQLFLEHSKREKEYITSGRFLNPFSSSPRKPYEVVYRTRANQ